MLTSRTLYALVAFLAASSVSAAPLAPRAGNSKAGLAISDQEASGDFVKQFFGGSSSLSWWHNWFSNNDHLGANSGLFIPSVYTDTQYYEDAKFQPGTKFLMGWNEPDLELEGVASKVDPKAAETVNRWKAVIAHRDKDPSIKIVSPSAAGGLEWLTDFFKTICPSGLDGCALSPDYIGVHAYGPGVDDFKNKVNSFKGFGRPVYVTEWASHDWSGGAQPNEAAVSKYMSKQSQSPEGPT